MQATKLKGFAAQGEVITATNVVAHADLLLLLRIALLVLTAFLLLTTGEH